MLINNTFNKFFPVIILIVSAGEDVTDLPRRIREFLIEQFKINQSSEQAIKGVCLKAWGGSCNKSLMGGS